jgi:hypothetical protein
MLAGLDGKCRRRVAEAHEQEREDETDATEHVVERLVKVRGGCIKGFYNGARAICEKFHKLCNTLFISVEH